MNCIHSLYFISQSKCSWFLRNRLKILLGFFRHFVFMWYFRINFYLNSILPLRRCALSIAAAGLIYLVLFIDILLNNWTCFFYFDIRWVRFYRFDFFSLFVRFWKSSRSCIHCLMEFSLRSLYLWVGIWFYYFILLFSSDGWFDCISNPIGNSTFNRIIFLRSCTQ